ncbi:MAG: hypothetical protein AAB663_00695 [Patescibacteria group bacterium]
MLFFPQPRSSVINNAPLPIDYSPYLAHPGYVSREVLAQSGFATVQSGDAHGVTWKYGPFRFERYVGDTEPVADADGPFRLQTWQRVGRTDIPQGWKESSFVMRTSRTGHATVDSGPDYFKNWASHAQRHRKNWLKHDDWEIAPITIEEYLAAYKRSRMDKFLKFLFTSLLKQKAKGQGDLLHIVGAKRKVPHALTEAGFAYVDVPETRQSTHVMSFHTDAAKAVSAGTGLMDHWFQHAQQTGIRYLEFGTFWTPGEPNSWKGFSHFKGQFGITFHDYPRPLARWVGDKRRLFR